MKQDAIDAIAGVVRTGLDRHDDAGRAALDMLLSLIQPDAVPVVVSSASVRWNPNTSRMEPYLASDDQAGPSRFSKP